MTPRLSIFEGADGAGQLYPLTIGWGRPPEKDSVVAILNVAVRETALLRENVIFWALLTALKMAIGNDDVAVDATVPGFQFAIL